MTTAVYRDGLLIADTRAYGFCRMPVGTKTKVHQLKSGSLFACSAVDIGVPGLVKRWIEEGMDREKIPDVDCTVEAIVVQPGGNAMIISQSFAPSYVEAPFFAIGSGKEYAMAALHLGHSPEEALRVACDLDPWTDFPLRGITHKGDFVEYTRRGLAKALKHGILKGV